MMDVPKSTAILFPVLALVFWTFLVLNALGYSRIRAGLRGQIRPEDFRLGESPTVPEGVRLTNRNYMNLLELPVLFYVGCVVIYITGMQTGTLLGLAWAYVGLRVVHSLIHLGYNQVMHRLYVFVASNITLLVLWILIALSLFQR